ncbi:MAG: CHASE3 domain-containing protein [Pseudomonadota bacterium]
MALTQGTLFRQRKFWTAPLALLLAVVLVVFSEYSFRKTGEVVAARNQMMDHRQELNRLLRSMLHAESGQRGYLLTGRLQYKQPFVAASTQVEDALSKIESQYTGVPERQADLRELRTQVRRKVDQLNASLLAFEEGRDEWRELVLVDIERENMAGIEGLVQKLVQSENRQLEQNHLVLTRTFVFSRLGIVLLVIFCCLALLVSIKQARRLALEREARAIELLGERDRLEAQVQRRTHQLTEIAKHLQTAREDERGRLARELHDELGGLLTAAKLDVARLRKKLPDASAELAERITHLVTTLDAGIALKRRIIEDLRPSSLTNLGLVPSLEILCAEFTERSGIQVIPHLTEVKLQQYAQLTIYRLVQEALTNTAKYAQATTVKVVLNSEQGWASVSVEDNGIGFDPDALPPSTHGLAGMQFRVQSGNGELSIWSRPGEGTRIIARLPESVER